MNPNRNPLNSDQINKTKGTLASSRPILVAPMSFNKMGALKFSGMIFLNIIQNRVEVERFRENQNHN